MNLATPLARHGARTAIRFEGETLSYADFETMTARAAHELRTRHGVRHGDRVAVLATNHPATLALLHACARLGAILLPLNWRLAVPELRYILDHAEPRIAFADPALAETLHEAAPHLPAAPLHIPDGEADADGPGTREDPVLLVYTSGTTGRPKGALLTQDALLHNAAMSHDMHAMTAEDQILAVLPFFHVGGLNIQVTPALQCGAAVTIHPRFAPDATLAAIATDRPSLAVLVPATIRALLDAPAWPRTDLSSLRAVTTGSEPIHPALVHAITARGVPVLQVYGATESAPIAIHTRPGDGTPPESTGLPGRHCEARIADEHGRDLPHGTPGEILLRGPNLFSGYWRDEPATRAAHHGPWYRTGDVATRDAQGRFHVHDRLKNLIISGGENIYPAEVERALLEHPGIAEAAVLGAPDPRWGEIPVAHVVPRPGVALTEEEVRAHAATLLARFKVPRRVVVTDSLPRTALGKVRHVALRGTPGTR